MTNHAVRQYRARAPSARWCSDDEILTSIERDVAAGTALEPIQRLLFLHPNRSVVETDEYVRNGEMIFVLNHPRRGGRWTCVTVMRATPAQIRTLDQFDVRDESPPNKPATSPAPILPPPGVVSSPPFDIQAFVAALGSRFHLDSDACQRIEQCYRALVAEGAVRSSKTSLRKSWFSIKDIRYARTIDYPTFCSFVGSYVDAITA